MNFRSTASLFAILLGLLWIFGLMLATKKTALDESAIVPTLAKVVDLKPASITIVRRGEGKQAEEYVFTNNDDAWTMKTPGAKSDVRVEGFRIRQMIDQVKGARKNDEAGVTDNLPEYGLDQPKTTVVIRGSDGEKDATEWKFYLGNESADKVFIYANSSDRPKRVFAVAKNSLDSLLFKDANHLRSRRIFDIMETTAQTLELKGPTGEIELKKGDDNVWRFVKPALGVADYEGPPLPKDPKETKFGAKLAEGGVKGLIGAIATMRVDSEDDFVPPSDTNLANFGLEDGKETMRISLGAPAEKKEKDDKPGTNKELLLIGHKTQDKGRDLVFARLQNDSGVFKLSAKLLEPVKKALQAPGELRSLDIASLDAKKVDLIQITQGKYETRLIQMDGKWEVRAGGDKAQKASDKAVQALLDAVEGKRDIKKFFDEGDAKKLDAELGLDSPTAEVAIYIDGLDKTAKEEKDTKKDEKTDKEKPKDDAPRLKKDAKPTLTLSFGKADAETVNVKRVTADGTTSRFTVPRSLFDKVAPEEGALAFLDTALPDVFGGDITRLEIARAKDRMEVIKGSGDQANRWYIKDKADASGKSLADVLKTNNVLGNLVGLQAKKWVKRIGATEDLEKYGLKTPSVTATLYVVKDDLSPAATAGMAAILASQGELRAFAAAAYVAAQRHADKGEKVVFEFGKELDQGKERLVYARHSGKDLLFAVPADLARALRDADLRDRTTVLLTEPLLAVAILGMEAGEPLTALLSGSPLISRQVHRYDGGSVKEIKVAVRTREELRTFAFQRDPQSKERDWQDKSGLQEFQPDPKKVNAFIDDLVALKAERWIAFSGEAKGEQKLNPKDATLKIDLTFDNGAGVTLLVGAPFERGGYFAESSASPGVVFLIPSAKVDPLLRGPAYFGKDRVALLP